MTRGTGQDEMRRGWVSHLLPTGQL